MNGGETVKAAIKPGTPEAAQRVQDVLEHSRDVLDRGKHFRPPPRFALFDDDELEKLPEPSWLIQGVLPSNGMIALVGAPKSYKSFVALDWACHIALGLDWHGRTVKQGPVVYVYAEGVAGLRQRVSAWKRYGRIDHKLGVFFLPRRVSLNEEDDVADFIDSIERRVGSSPVLVAIDTVSRNLSGDESSSVDMPAFIRGCDAVRERTGAGVLNVHHIGHSTGADKRSRGHSSFEAACDTVILCARDEDRLTLECKWMKDAPDGWQLGMESLAVPPSLVLKPSGVNAGGLTGQRLACLQVLHDQYSEDGGSYTSWKDATGLANSSFAKAQKWLSAERYVSKHGSRWRLTDAGTTALSTRSTTTPPQLHHPPSGLLHPAGGLYKTPAVESELSRLG